MKWAIAQLEKIAKPFNFEYSYDLWNALENKGDVLSVEECMVNGCCCEAGNDDFVFEIKVNAKVMMQCAVSLEAVLVPVSFEFNARFSCEKDDLDAYPILKDTIDLDPVVLSEIVINLPYRVVKPGYETRFEEEDNSPNINPELASLKTLFGGEEK